MTGVDAERDFDDMAFAFDDLSAHGAHPVSRILSGRDCRVRRRDGGLADELDAARGADGAESFDPGGGRARVADIQPGQMGQGFQAVERGVGDPAAIKVQLFELRHAGERLDTRVGYLRPEQVQLP